MDQIKIGEFIAQRRKKQELTQMQFAELVGVSNKTVSKWETGARMPDVAIIQDVCNVLKITINELLAGEEFSEKEYMKKTEDNVMGLVQEINEIKETKWSRVLGILCSIIAIICALLLTMIHILGIINIPLFLNIPTLFYMIGLFFFMLGITGAFTRYIAGYKCWLKIKKYNENEMYKIICTLEYARRLTLTIGFFVSFISAMGIGLNYKYIDTIGHFMAGAVLSLFYMICMEFIHAQILYKCKLESYQ